MDDTAPPSQSQQPLIPLLFDNLHAHNIDVNEDNLSLSLLVKTFGGEMNISYPSIFHSTLLISN
jgi:hypothetical protein